MISSSTKTIRGGKARFSFIAAAFALIALAFTAAASAHSPWDDNTVWPDHGQATAQCDYVAGLGDVILSPMPNMKDRPENIISGISVDDSGNSTSAVDAIEWKYYRIRAWSQADGWQTSRKWAATSVSNYVTGNTDAYTLVGGVWHRVDINLFGGNYDANSNLIGVKPGNYYVVGELWWGSIPGFDLLGPHYDAAGWVTCP